MAFPQPNAQRELANRKILEELQLKKQLLLKQGVASTLNSSALPVLGSTTVQSTDGHSMNSVQRAALQTAHTQSTGFFISQDSSFEERLQCISEFEKPKLLLEQYVTPSHLGSHMLYTIQSQYGDLTGKLVADLGSGCGALSVGAAVLDAALVVGFEIDSDALDIFSENVEDHCVTNIDAVQCDVLKDIPNRFVKLFDTVLMNPPFGTKHNAGIDMKFLEAAVKLSNNAVYSLHKTSTRQHVLKHAESLGAKGEVLAELRYDLPSTYKFHKKNAVDIQCILSVSKMSAQYARDNCKIAVAKILQTIGWHSINSTPLEVLTDILARYIRQISEVTKDYSNEYGQTEPNLDHLGLAFHEMGINLPELEEYVTYVNFAPGPAPVPKFPIPKENNLNFLKPGSKEVVTRPVYIHEHLPPMYPLLEGGDNETEVVTVKQEVTEEESTDGAQQFKKPADVSSPEFKRPKREEEGSRPTREISSVMMTTSGFLSPAREGKLPEARTPAPPPIPEPPPPVTASPMETGRKKVDKKKERIGKELFKPIPEEKALKKTPTMKDVVKMKQMKAAAAAAANVAANSTPNVVPPNVNTQNEVKIMPIPQHKGSQKQNFNKDLAAAKAKTEKFNTTITPIPMKPRSPHPPPMPMSQVDKLFTEPDKKKVNIFKKISNVKEKHENKAKKDIRTNLLMNEASPVDIVNKITHLSSDITIEPIMNPVPVSRSPDKLDTYFDHHSPIGTPSTPKTPEIIAPSPPLPKEKRKRKDGGQKRKRVKKNPNLLEPDIIDITMERPKTPEAHIVPHMRHQPPPNLLSPTIPYPLLRYSGPGLIPNNLNESLPLFPFPYLPNIPDFGINPYFPSMPPNMPAQTKPPPTPKVKEHVEKPVDIIPQPTPPAQPIPIEESTPTTSTPLEVKDKKTKDHKKEKKDKIKKKNKKDKVKEKSEKKKLKELKKDNKEKIKKEKKEKKVKEKEIREGESPIPKILLKVNSPSPRPETPESTRKLNIKPIVKKDQEPSVEEKKRDASPVGLAKISALVTGPPKPKTSNLSPVAPAVAERPVTDEAPPVPVPRTPGRPRLHPVKPKPPPKPKKLEQTFKKTDEHGNEVWICPACGQQDDGRPMIGCDGCDAWYHWVCVGIQVPPDENENWYCKPCLCRKNEDLQSDKKRKRKKRDKKEH